MRIHAKWHAFSGSRLGSVAWTSIYTLARTLPVRKLFSTNAHGKMSIFRLRLTRKPSNLLYFLHRLALSALREAFKTAGDPVIGKHSWMDQRSRTRPYLHSLSPNATFINCSISRRQLDEFDQNYHRARASTSILASIFLALPTV